MTPTLNIKTSDPDRVTISEFELPRYLDILNSFNRPPNTKGKELVRNGVAIST